MDKGLHAVSTAIPGDEVGRNPQNLRFIRSIFVVEIEFQIYSKSSATTNKFRLFQVEKTNMDWHRIAVPLKNIKKS